MCRKFLYLLMGLLFVAPLIFGIGGPYDPDEDTVLLMYFNGGLANIGGMTTGGLLCVPFSPEIERQLKSQAIWDQIVTQIKATHNRGVDMPSPRPYRHTKDVDTVRALAILIGFQDLSPIYYPGVFDTLIFSQDVYPSGSVHDYYWEASCSQFYLVGDVVGWFTGEHGYQWYGYGAGGFGPYPHNAQRLTEEAVAAADSLVDYSLYDNDGDGYVDALFIVHAGKGREDTGNNDYIHSHVWGISPHYYDGVTIRIYSMEPELRANGSLVEIGVYCHEFGHLLGLPDLYDYDGSSAGLGSWSIMAGGCWADGGDTPVHFDAWCKKELGWVTPIIPDSNTTNVQILPVELYPISVRLWRDNIAGAQYFLVEFRKCIGFDSHLPGEGVLVYHIDETVWGNNNEWHPLVAVEQADGEFDLQYGYNWGDSGDPFPGSTDKHEFDDITTPNSNSYEGELTLVGLYNIDLHDSIATADMYFSAEGRPRPPRQLTAVPGLCSIELSWRTNPESDIVAYRVYLDGNSVAEISDTFYFIDELTDTLYLVGVTAVDNGGYESCAAEIMVTPITLSRAMLVVDETRNGTGIPGSPDDDQVDVFYHNILAGYSFTDWDVDSLGLPGLRDLGHYSLIIWHSDDYACHQLQSVIPNLALYLHAGGKLWLVGWRPIAAIMGGTYPFHFEGDFPYDYLKLQNADESTSNDFSSAGGLLGYPDISVDSTKIPSSWDGKMKYIDIFTPLDSKHPTGYVPLDPPDGVKALAFYKPGVHQRKYSGVHQLADACSGKPLHSKNTVECPARAGQHVAEPIYFFNSASGDTSFQDKPCGVRCLDGSYKVIFFGFPLYFMEEDEATQVAQKVLSDLEVGIEEEPPTPKVFALHQNYPNPFSSETDIRFQIPDCSKVSLKIYDVSGRLVRTLVDGYQAPGRHTVSWDGRDDIRNKLGSGVYFVRFKSGRFTNTRKVVILR